MSEKKINWGIVGLMAAMLPSVVALAFTALPSSISKNWILVIGAILLSMASMSACLVISIIAHAKDMEGKHWSILGVCMLPSPFLVIALVGMLTK